MMLQLIATADEITVDLMYIVEGPGEHGTEEQAKALTQRAQRKNAKGAEGVVAGFAFFLCALCVKAFWRLATNMSLDVFVRGA